MREWTNLIVGFIAGILIMALLNGFMVTDREKEMQKGMQLEAQLTDLHEEEGGDVNEKEKASYNAEISESEAREESAGNSVRVFNSMELSQDFINEMMLYQYVEYGIRKYNESNGGTQRYSVNLQDMLPYDAQFCMNDENEKPFKTDLAKEMIPELSNNLYNFELENEKQSIYMSIDTYNMKIYVYDNMVK